MTILSHHVQCSPPCENAQGHKAATERHLIRDQPVHCGLRSGGLLPRFGTSGNQPTLRYVELYVLLLAELLATNEVV